MCDDAKCTKKTVDRWQTFQNSTLTIDIKQGIPLTEKFLATNTSGNVMIT